MNLESHLLARRESGAKLLVPYVTGGLGGWVDVVRAIVDAGADAVEIGIPFSDPVMDGVTIQEASQRALAEGATPSGILTEARSLEVGVPLVVMTYYNTVHHAGHERFAASLVDAGIDGAIVPDLPLDELGGWGVAADAAGVETVLLAAPTTTDATGRAASSTASRCSVSPGCATTSRRRRSRWGSAASRSRTARCSSASGSRHPTRRSVPPPRPTVSSWGVRSWSASCAPATRRPPTSSWPSCGRRSTSGGTDD
jgi:tryptophan synthase alpha subunit